MDSKKDAEVHEKLKWLRDGLWADDAVFDQLYEVMADRQLKYGPGNIARHGVQGVLVRLDDKLSRLSHTSADFEDERLKDAWIDIANYAIIALLWLDGKWPGSEDG